MKIRRLIISVADNNELHLLTRYPSQLKLYLEWSADANNKWGSVTNFIVKNRLHWEPASPEECQLGSLFGVLDPEPLSNPADYKILVNDWPYGVGKDISHLIVWSKHRLPTTPGIGDLTPKGRSLLEDFVESKFRSKLGADDVLWFRNWIGLQSVRSLEHFHVLVRYGRGRIDKLLQ